MAGLGEVVNVALLPEGKMVARDNMNVVAVFTSEMGSILSTSNRASIYGSMKSVGDDFGTNSKIYEYAKVFFAQTPNAVQMGGAFVAAYWRAIDEDVPATSAKLIGNQISEAETIGVLERISDGSIDITIDGTAVSVSGLDFRGETDLNGVAGIINTALDGASVFVVDGRFNVVSDTTGALSTITFASDSGTGTYIGDIIAISDGSGAVITQGTDATVLPAETKEDALLAVSAEVNFKGFGFIDAPTDIERISIAEWANASGKIGYDVVSGDTVLKKDPSSVAWNLVLNSLSNYRLVHSKSNDRKKWAAYASRAHTANFNAENSALTMHLKTLNGVLAEDYSDTELSKAKIVGIDVYTTIKDVPAVLTSGANDYVDNVYNLIAYVNAVQTDTYNLLKGTATKVPQTKHGVNQIVDTVEKSTRGFVRAGVFAPGTWTSPDSFGDIETFKKNIEKFGYYVLAGELSDQPQSDRQARKSPVIQVAVKNAGAIHSVDVIINFNY